jgi:hypothetical protein
MNRYGLSVREQRWPWLLTAGLMLASAVAAAWSTYLHWLPCRGSMLRGSIIHNYDYDYDGGSFSDLCLRRMDGDQGPWESELNVVAMVLLGVAWLALVLGLRWQLRTKAVAALSGLATLAVAGATVIGDARYDSFPMMLLLSSELSAVVALVAISVWQPETHGRHIHQRHPDRDHDPTHPKERRGRRASGRPPCRVAHPRLSAVFATRSSGRYSREFVSLSASRGVELPRRQPL